MTTAIAVYNSEGLVGRCDCRCHEAKGADCHCICGGALHGVGALNAGRALDELIDPDGDLLRAYAEAHEPPLDPEALRVEFPQGALW